MVKEKELYSHALQFQTYLFLARLALWTWFNEPPRAHGINGGVQYEQDVNYSWENVKGKMYWTINTGREEEETAIKSGTIQD